MMNIHKELLNRGIDSYVAWGRGRNVSNDHEFYMNDDFGVKIHGVYTRITDKHGFLSAVSTKRLLRWLDKIKPDIIHLHCIHGYYVNIKLLFEYIKKNSIQVIWTQHDCWAFTGHCAYFDACGCNKWIEGCYHCQQLDTYPASKLFDHSKWNWEKKRELFSNAKITIVTPSEWLATLVKKSFLGQYHVQTIHNGIDTNVFKPIKSNFKWQNSIENKKVILGVASEWTERKGLKDFIKLDTLIDHEKYQIVIVGDLGRQLHTLPTSIISLKRTNNAQGLAEIYSSSYVFFNPTYEDNFPTTNLESLACGTPVITYNTGGSPEAIVTNNGYVIEKGDLNAFLYCLNSVDTLNNINLEENFSKETMIGNYIELYKQLIDSQGKR